MLSTWRTGTSASPLAGFNLTLDQFDGPFDLLVSLIEEQGFDITTVSLLKVTSQYLEYVERLRGSFAEATSEFLAVASQLLLLKSRLLLPGEPLEDDEGERPGELAERLRLYSAFRSLARELDRLQELDMPSFVRLAATAALTPEIRENGAEVSELLGALERMCAEEAPAGGEMRIPEVRFDLRTRIASVRDRIRGAGSLSFADLAAECVSRLEIVYTFLAALHLVLRREVKLEQRRTFGEITLLAVKLNE